MKKTVDELSKEEVLKIFEKDFSNRLQRKLHSDFWGYFGSPAEKISKPYYTIDFHFWTASMNYMVRNGILLNELSILTVQ